MNNEERFAKWWKQANRRPPPRRPTPEQLFWPGIFETQDPYAQIIEWRRRDSVRNRPVVGIDMMNHLPILAAPDSQLLAIGRSGTGKTSGPIVTNALLAPGPLLTWSTRSDILTTVAMARGRLGDVWLLRAG